MGKLDDALGEFWMENPWDPTEHNLSAYERNRILLNNRQGGFVDVSHLTTADSDADSRSVAAADINDDGMQDLLVRNSGADGGSLLVFLNEAPKQHWLQVSLRGSESNSFGLGARLIAKVGDQTLCRQMYPVSCFRAQQPSLVYFGLSGHTQVDSLTIVWPTGKTQVLHDVAADRHILVRELDENIETFGRSKK